MCGLRKNRWLRRQIISESCLEMVICVACSGRNRNGNSMMNNSKCINATGMDHGEFSRDERVLSFEISEATSEKNGVENDRDRSCKAARYPSRKFNGVWQQTIIEDSVYLIFVNRAIYFIE